jgi:hypothetical protein
MAAGNARFRLMAMQLAAALSSYNLEPPETLGHSGFNIAFEYAVANINNRETIWPTEGAAMPAQLLIPTIHLRKGLPFSFEVGAKVSYLQSSQMAAGTVELKWALNEGFFYFPDFGVRGHATHLVGAKDFNLTTAGLDLGIGHQFAVGGMLTLTPYGGFDLQWVNASSSVIDFNPGRDISDALHNPTDETGVLATVAMHQNYNYRGYVGLRLISYVFEFGLEASMVDSVRVAMADGSMAKTRSWVFAGKFGIDF